MLSNSPDRASPTLSNTPDRKIGPRPLDWPHSPTPPHGFSWHAGVLAEVEGAMTGSLIAVAHIGGSLAAVLALGAFLNRIESRSYRRNREQIFEEASAKLGVAADDLDTGELRPELLQFFAERFSSELPGNRTSDLLGVIRTVWVLLGFLLQGVVLSGITWYVCMNNGKGAVQAWWLVAISLVFGIAGIILSFVCKHLTGRFPGQAGQARKGVAQLRESLQLAAWNRVRHEHDECRAQIERDERQSNGELCDQHPLDIRHGRAL